MNQQEAWKLCELKKPCFYIGQKQHLRDIPFYIKDVANISARINLSPDPWDYQNCRSVHLVNLISEQELNMKKAIAPSVAAKAIANRS